MTETPGSAADATADDATADDATADDATAGDATADDATADDAATDGVRVAFVCVQNAGRSQMSAAFAELERERRGLEDRVEVLTGGTRPADSVHEGVVETMADVGVDLSDRTPREVSTAELETCDYVATMGCSTLDLDAAVDVRDWALDDPDGQSPGRVREIREAVREHVRDLFDEIEAVIE